MELTDSVLKENRPIGTSGWIAEVVRDSIFNGTLKSGDRIVEGKLAKQLNVGISPVREALQQLEYMGLVTRYPNRGTYITRLTETEVKQIYRLRAELEALSVKYALESPNRSGIDRLQQCADQMVMAAANEDYPSFFAHDIEFHNQVCRIAGDQYLEKCLVGLTTPLFAFVLIRLKQEPILFDFAALSEKHQQIVNLFSMSDPAKAAEEMRKIMHGFSEAVLKNLYGSP
ncbi:MAG TPA: GntR family transcriptional regulator [Blastocatellia bacterium]|nr:GntR family transcriptional regulator [Blastocatellia bacterium]